MAFTGTISHEGEQAPPQDVIDAAVHCAEQVRAQRDALGSPRLVKGFDLSDGSQVYVLDMEHVWKVHIIPPFDLPTEDQPAEIDRIKILDEPIVTIAGLVSGGASVITLDSHQENEEEGRPWSGWYVKNDAVNLMPETAELFTRKEVAYKVGVQENPIFAPFDRVLSEHVYSQFATTEPGNYTGAMRSIVQLLLGVGKMLDRDYEQRWLEAEPEERSPLVLAPPDPDREEFDIPDVPTSFYSGEGLKEIQISYDRHWNRTHGVMWGRDQNDKRVPLLVELGQRGIHVMPFPVDELSKLPEVQAHYKRVYPDLERYTPFWNETADLFEAFGGFPTGERMSGVKEELDREVRAGWVIEADRGLGAFYSGLTMCTGFGWAFDDETPRAINTMYKYNERGQKIGYCYEVRLDITEKSDSQKVRNTVSAQLIAVLGLSTPADRYKAERIDQDTAEGFLQSGDYDEFDAYVVSPDWEVRASVIEIRRGFIEYHAFQCPLNAPCLPIGSPHFKYFEPLLGAVVNFSFERAHKDVPMPLRSDGPIFAAYANGSAEILNYFNDRTPANTSPEIINTLQPCQFVGGWSTGSISEHARLAGYFYTSSRDFRRLWNFGSLSRTDYQGEINGNHDYMSFCAFFASHCSIVKMWTGSHTYTAYGNGGKSFRVSVSCASNNRSMFFIIDHDHESAAWSREGYSGRKHLGISGAARYGSIYNFIWHWTGVCATDDHPDITYPACHMDVSDPVVFAPLSCLGTDPPIAPRYEVCCVDASGNFDNCRISNTGTIVVVSPSVSNPGAVIQSAAITRGPTLPPAWSSPTSTPEWRYKYKVYAFGHPLLHNRVIKEYEEVITDSQLNSTPSWPDWWRCSIPGQCPAYPWRVVANYYGPPYVGTSEEFGLGWVERGIKPQVGGRYFGIVY